MKTMIGVVTDNEDSDDETGAKDRRKNRKNENKNDSTDNNNNNDNSNDNNENNNDNENNDNDNDNKLMHDMESAFQKIASYKNLDDMTTKPVKSWDDVNENLQKNAKFLHPTNTMTPVMTSMTAPNTNTNININKSGVLENISIPTNSNAFETASVGAETTMSVRSTYENTDNYQKLIHKTNFNHNNPQNQTQNDYKDDNETGIVIYFVCVCVCVCHFER